MSQIKIGSRTLLLTLLMVVAGSIGTSQTAEAYWGWGWGHHHRWHAHRWHYRPYRPVYYSYSWPVYRSYSFYSYPRYYSYPVYTPRFYAPAYYAPTYYVSPFVGIGCFSQTDTVTPSAPLLAEPVVEAVAKEQESFVDSIALHVNVPDDAKVTINDRETEIEGGERAFVANGLVKNESYEFVVRAEVERDGVMSAETKRVVMRGGDVSTLDFDFSPAKLAAEKTRPSVDTVLRIHVPQDASVYLAGQEMKQKGPMRVFKTSKLDPGQEFTDYTIRVVMNERQGEAEERSVTLIGGETQDVEIGVDTLRMASL